MKNNPWITEKKGFSKKKVLVTVGLIVVLFVASVLAVNWIYSNIVQVKVGAYSFQGSLVVDDDVPIQYQNVTFSGTLYYNGSRVDSGYNVTLFNDDVDVAFGLTDGSGDFSIVYNVTEVGTFDFKVGYLPG